MATVMPKSKFKSDRATKAFRSLIGDFKRVYQNAQRFLWTLDQITARKNELRSGENYIRLPGRDQAALFEFDHYFWNEYWQSIAWTHVLDGVRRWSGDPYHEGRHGEIGNQEPKLSAHCYAVAIKNDGQEPRLILVPHIEEERQRDLATGVLLQADIEAIISPHLTGANVVHLLPDQMLSPHIREQKIRYPSSVGDVQNQAGLSHYLLGQIKF